MDNFDLRKYLAEGRLYENEEQGYTLFTTNVEYDNGKTGYMFQLVNSEDREENEIGFDQLFFDDEDNRLEMGVDSPIVLIKVAIKKENILLMKQWNYTVKYQKV